MLSKHFCKIAGAAILVALLAGVAVAQAREKMMVCDAGNCSLQTISSPPSFDWSKLGW